MYTQVEASGVLLTIRYMCDPRRRRTSEQTIWEDILRAFAQHPDIEFAYPTRRFYNRGQEVNKNALPTETKGHNDTINMATD